jgi:L-arabinose isomerase
MEGEFQMNINSTAKIGLLLIGSRRFRELGKDTARGEYAARKGLEAQTIINSISAAGEIVYNGVIYEREDVKESIRSFYDEQVDCVVAIYLSWSDDFAWIRFLRDMPPVPIFFGSIIRDSIDVTDTNDEDQFVEFLSAGSLVGALEASGSVARFKRPMMETTIGSLEQVSNKVKTFANASRVKSILKESTVGLLACYNEVMWSTYVDPYSVFMKVGPELRFLSVAQLFEKTNSISEKSVDEVVNSLNKQFTSNENVDNEKLRASVKASLAMEELAEAFNLDLLVLNDVDPVLFELIGLRPGFVPTNKKSQLSVVPEGDIGGGLAVYILHLLSGKNGNFIEPFYIDKINHCFFAGHAGPNNYWQNPENTIIARDERFAKTKYKYAGAPFAWYVFPEGQKTMLHLSQSNGSMKMVCTLVEALPAKHTLASYSHGIFRHATLEPQELFDKILNIGVTQHYGIVDGDYLDELEYLAKLMDFEFYRI